MRLERGVKCVHHFFEVGDVITTISHFYKHYEFVGCLCERVASEKRSERGARNERGEGGMERRG